MNEPFLLESLDQVWDYWNHWYRERGAQRERYVAGQMTRVVSNPHFEDWYDASRDEAVGFAAIFDLVSDLETPLIREITRDEAWRRVGRLLEEWRPEDARTAAPHAASE